MATNNVMQDEAVKHFPDGSIENELYRVLKGEGEGVESEVQWGLKFIEAQKEKERSDEETAVLRRINRRLGRKGCLPIQCSQ